METIKRVSSAHISTIKQTSQTDPSTEGYWYVRKSFQHHGVGTMILLTVLVISVNYGKSGIKEIQERRSI